MPDIPCHACPLRKYTLFVPHTAAQLKLIHALKSSERRRPAGSILIQEGEAEVPVFTILDGWAFRYKTLADGSRQILNFLHRGDLVGVQQHMGDAAAHGVEAVTDILLCVFKPDAVWDLHREDPRLGFDVTWVTACEERLVDNHLLSVGRRSARRRIAALLVGLFRRAAATDRRHGRDGIAFPLTQQHLADALGLSLVHTNKTLNALQRENLFRLADGRLTMLQLEALAELADIKVSDAVLPRPLI